MLFASARLSIQWCPMLLTFEPTMYGNPKIRIIFIQTLSFNVKRTRIIIHTCGSSMWDKQPALCFTCKTQLALRISLSRSKLRSLSNVIYPIEVQGMGLWERFFDLHFDYQTGKSNVEQYFLLSISFGNNSVGSVANTASELVNDT